MLYNKMTVAISVIYCYVSFLFLQDVKLFTLIALSRASAVYGDIQ